MNVSHLGIYCPFSAFLLNALNPLPLKKLPIQKTALALATADFLTKILKEFL